MDNSIINLVKSKFLKNTGWIVVAQIYQMLISLFIGVISARYLGPSNYGTISYAASYISFFTIACTLGLEGIVVKEMISNRDNEGVVLGSSIFMRLIAGLISMFVVCFIIWKLNSNDKILLVVAFLQSIVLVFNAFNIIDTWYQSYLKSKVSALVKCSAYTIMSGYKVWLLLTGKNVEWFAFSTSLDSIIIAVLFLALYRTYAVQRLKINLLMMKQLIGKSYHLIISSLMAVIYSQMDKLMIGKIIDQTHVGYYAVAVAICNMWMFIPQALANSARPIIMGLKEKDEDLYIKRLKQLNCAILWIGIMFAVVISILSKFIVLILYGEDYLAAQKPLILVIWSTVFSSMSYSRAIWMICESKQKYIKYILAWGVIVNLGLNVILIPKIGINGAAIATLITEIATCLVAPWFYKDTRIFVKYLFEALFMKGI